MYRILVVKYVLYNNHLEERENGKISLTLPRLNLMYVVCMCVCMYVRMFVRMCVCVCIYICMYSHHTAQRIQCASIRKTKQLYELGPLTCAGFEEKIHPTFTGLQVFNTNLSQTNDFYIYHLV